MNKPEVKGSVYSPWGSQRVGHDWATFTSTYEGNTHIQEESEIWRLYIDVNCSETEGLRNVLETVNVILCLA